MGGELASAIGITVGVVGVLATIVVGIMQGRQTSEASKQLSAFLDEWRYTANDADASSKALEALLLEILARLESSE